MDNLTHSLAGLALGELLHRSLVPEADDGRQRRRRRLLLFASWVASNLPDLDLLLTPLLPSPLGYLLHHRGHTHTLLFALPQALLLWALIWLLWPSAGALLKASAPARRALAASIALGLGLHLAMDFLNSYGLHPFYPFDARWFYGDAVFIVEPLFWVALGVPMALTLRGRVLKSLPLAALAGALCLFAARALLAWGALAVLLAIGVGLGVLQRRAGAHGRRALATGVALCAAFVALQGGASALGKQRIRTELQRRDPAARVLDVALTAYPTQPLCWNFVSVESDEGAGRYRLRRGVISLAPGWLAPDRCPAGLGGGAPRVALTPAIAQAAEAGGSLATLRRLRAEDCRFEAWLRFARAPLLAVGEATDLRFGGLLIHNFSTLNLSPSGPRACPGHVPGWDYPRADLLTPPAT